MTVALLKLGNHPHAANAADDRIYVIHANGAVQGRQTSAWFERSSNIRIRPGDAIIVPLDAERKLTLPIWMSVSTILYNIAVAVAAVNSF